MIPDCQRRIQAAYADLQLLMVREPEEQYRVAVRKEWFRCDGLVSSQQSEDWSGLTGNEQYKAAQAVLEEHKELASS